MNAMRVLACLLGASLVTPALIRADEPSEADLLKEDLRQLQGKWEYTFKDKEGMVRFRKVKDVKDNTERVTWYAPDGAVRMVNTVEFKLEMKDKNKVCRYFNGKVVEGAAKGKAFASGSFAYTLEGDTWTELYRMDEKYAWKRVKEKDGEMK